MMNVQTDLLGKRVEVKPRGSEYWTDTRDSGREPISGIVRSIAAGSDGMMILQIQDDDGWLHTRSTSSMVFRVTSPPPQADPQYRSPKPPFMLPSEVSKVRAALARRRFSDLRIGDRFRFVKAPPGWFDGKLVVLEQNPGWAMPEGWGFVLFSKIQEGELLNAIVELLDEPAPVPTGPQIPQE